jgi:hypothetical protein
LKAAPAPLWRLCGPYRQLQRASVRECSVTTLQHCAFCLLRTHASLTSSQTPQPPRAALPPLPARRRARPPPPHALAEPSAQPPARSWLQRLASNDDLFTLVFGGALLLSLAAGLASLATGGSLGALSARPFALPAATLLLLAKFVTNVAILAVEAACAALYAVPIAVAIPLSIAAVVLRARRAGARALRAEPPTSASPSPSLSAELAALDEREALLCAAERELASRAELAKLQANLGGELVPEVDVSAAVPPPYFKTAASPVAAAAAAAAAAVARERGEASLAVSPASRKAERMLKDLSLLELSALAARLLAADALEKLAGGKEGEAKENR